MNEKQIAAVREVASSSAQNSLFSDQREFMAIVVELCDKALRPLMGHNNLLTPPTNPAGQPMTYDELHAYATAQRRRAEIAESVVRGCETLSRDNAMLREELMRARMGKSE